MGDIKRVLWIDDYINNKASGMFLEEETKKVQTMDDALAEIASEHLYEYDTIVLDIDFENGLVEPEEVIGKLSQKIFLDKDQRNKDFIISNGGYLLFLYLLEKGYPSKQVAFLTGNAGIIGQLKLYNKLNEESLSKEEILEAFQEAWRNTEDDMNLFLEKIEALPIAKEYMDSDFVFDCAEQLDNEDIEGLKKLIFAVTPATVTENIQNTGDMMIFRFHEANLKAPMYFSKNDDDNITGHNRADANVWLQKGRTKERVTRWLVLSAADYVEKLYNGNNADMIQKVQSVLKLTVGDGGVRSAYRQMFYVLDGLRSVENSEGVSYQAVSAMLVPFDASPKYAGAVANSGEVGADLSIRRMCAFGAKQARNYCAHNSFGTELTEKTTLFIMMLSLTALLEKPRRAQMKWWYGKVEEMLSQAISGCSGTVSLTDKLNNLMGTLISNNDIELSKANVSANYLSYTAKDFVYALGYNHAMSRSVQNDASIRENYFLFTLAAFVVKWFDEMSEADAESIYGEETAILYKLSKRIVEAYEYGK